MTNRAPSCTKKGPGRRLVEGAPRSGSREYWLYGNKLARKAARQRVTLRHP